MCADTKHRSLAASQAESARSKNVQRLLEGRPSTAFKEACGADGSTVCRLEPLVGSGDFAHEVNWRSQLIRLTIACS